MMSTHLGEYAKLAIYMPPNIIPGMHGEKHCASVVNALLGCVVMKRPGIVRSLTAVLAGFVLLLAGWITAHVEPPRSIGRFQRLVRRE